MAREVEWTREPLNSNEHRPFAALSGESLSSDHSRLRAVEHRHTLDFLTVNMKVLIVFSFILAVALATPVDQVELQVEVYFKFDFDS